jgi:hypothetical protein
MCLNVIKFRLLLPVLILFSTGIFSQNTRPDIKGKPSFCFKVNGSANIFYGLKRENYNDVKILKTPPALGSDLSFLLGLNFGNNGTIYGGFGASIIPIHWGYNFISIYPIEYHYRDYDYNILFPIINIPLSFEYTSPIKDKHHFLTEVGLTANYNMKNDFSLYVEHSIQENPDYFQAEFHINDRLKWYPSGFIKLGYLMKFPKQGAISTGIRFLFSGAVLGKGSYRFNGLEGGELLQGEIKLPVNAVCIDFAYHFRYSKRFK